MLKNWKTLTFLLSPKAEWAEPLLPAHPFPHQALLSLFPFSLRSAQSAKPFNIPPVQLAGPHTETCISPAQLRALQSN